MKRLPSLLVILVLGACAKAPPVTPDSFYRLPEPTASGMAAVPLSQAIMLVRPLLSDGLRSERAILFSDDPRGLVLRQHHYHFWVDTPQRLVQRQLIAYLRARQAAPLVVADSDVPADQVISGHITRFEYSRDGERRTVHLGLELRLDAIGRERPLLLHGYQVDLPVAGAGMDALVVAFEQGLARIFKAFVNDAYAHEQGQSQRGRE